MPDAHPPDDYASLSEVRAALRQITPTQLKDLSTFAVMVCWTMERMGYFTGEELFNEALDKLADGRRRWNRSSDPTIMECFRGVINSLRSNRVEQLRTSGVLVTETGKMVPGRTGKAAVREIRTRRLAQRDLDWMPRIEKYDVERIVGRRKLFYAAIAHFKGNPYCVGYLVCIYTHAESTPADMVALLKSNSLAADLCGFSRGETITANNFSEAKRKIDKWVDERYPGSNREDSMASASDTDDPNDDGELLDEHGNDDFGADDAEWTLAAKEDEQS